MSAKEVRRGEVLSRVKRGELKLTEAAELLELSYRQAKRLKKRYGEGGSKALVHGNVGRASNRADDKRREQVLELVRENYSGEPHERFGSPCSLSFYALTNFRLILGLENASPC